MYFQYDWTILFAFIWNVRMSGDGGATVFVSIPFFHFQLNFGRLNS